MSTRWNIGRLFAWGILIAVLVVSLLPLWFTLKTALMHPSEMFENASRLSIPEPTLLNFKRVLGMLTPEQSQALGGSGAEMNFMRAFWNSVVFTTVIVACQVIFASMAAYAFARLEFPAKKIIFALFLGTMMVPGVVTFIPNFVLMKDLGLLNTTLAMVAPFCLMQGFSIFFLRQFFLSLPKELEEAAIIDGASRWTIFWKIVLPVSGTALATISLLVGINAWNEFFWPYLVAQEETKQVLPVALQTFKSQTPQGAPDWTGLMAAAVLALVPIALLLIFMGRRVVESLQHTGGK